MSRGRPAAVILLSKWLEMDNHATGWAKPINVSVLQPSRQFFGFFWFFNYLFIFAFLFFAGISTDYMMTWREDVANYRNVKK